jgi:hypothetical protein
MPSDGWSHEETDDPLHADRRNFYKVETWSRDGQRIEELLFARNSLAKAQRKSSIPLIGSLVLVRRHDLN